MDFYQKMRIILSQNSITNSKFLEKNNPDLYLDTGYELKSPILSVLILHMSQ